VRTPLIMSALAVAVLAAGCGSQQAAPSGGAAAPAVAQAASGPTINAPTFTDGDEYAIRLPSDTVAALQLPADLDLIVKHDGDSVVFASKQTPQVDAGVFTWELNAGMCPTQFQANNTLTRAKPCDQSAIFPLTVEKTWTDRYGVSTGGGEFVQQTGTGTVVGIESVTVPAGTFQAYRIDSRHGPLDRTTLWYAPTPVGFYVKAESSSPQSINFVLVSYHRAAAH
jgi:hypothetical protein